MANPYGYGSAIYGFTRGMQDERQAQQGEEAFKSEQAIRTERLKQEQEAAPIRTQALQKNLEVADVNLQQGRLNMDIATMNRDQQKKVFEEANKARDRMRVLTEEGLTDFIASGDPQLAAGALAKINPKFEGSVATRDQTTGAITLENPKLPNSKKEFKGRTWEDGTKMTPDDEYAIFLKKLVDPAGSIAAEEDYHRKMGLQKEVTGRAKAVAEARSEATGDAGRERRSDAFVDRQHTRLEAMVKDQFSGPGAMQATGAVIPGFSHANDQALQRYIAGAAADEIDEKGNLTAGRAYNNAVKRVQAETSRAVSLGRGYAQGLAGRRGLDPSKRDQLRRFGQTGDLNAQKLDQLVSAVEATYGPKVAQYVYAQATKKGAITPAPARAPAGAGAAAEQPTVAEQPG